MKKQDFSSLRPRIVIASLAWQYLGCRAVVEACEAAGWLKPKIRRRRLTLYSVASLDACADRIDRGEDPKFP